MEMTMRFLKIAALVLLFPVYAASAPGDPVVMSYEPEKTLTAGDISDMGTWITAFAPSAVLGDIDSVRCKRRKGDVTCTVVERKTLTASQFAEVEATFDSGRYAVVSDTIAADGSSADVLITRRHGKVTGSLLSSLASAVSSIFSVAAPSVYGIIVWSEGSDYIGQAIIRKTLTPQQRLACLRPPATCRIYIEQAEE